MANSKQTTYTASITFQDSDIDPIMTCLKIEPISNVKTPASENVAEVLYTEEEMDVLKKEALSTHYKSHINKTLAQPVGKFLLGLKIPIITAQLSQLAEGAIEVNYETNNSI
jgi:hypothetical protein